MSFTPVADEASSAPFRISALGLVVLVVTCALVMLLEGFDIQAMGIAAPTLMPQLHIDPVSAGFVFSGGQAGVVAGALFGGMVSDRMGRRNVLLLSVIIFGAFSVATAFVNDFYTLLFARVLTGFGLGAAMPNVIGLAVDVTSAKNRVKVVTMIMAGMPVGGAAVSLFAALYMKSLGWQYLFYIGGAIPLALALPILALPNTRAPKASQEKVNGWRALFGGGRGLSTILLWVVFFLTSSVLYMMLNWLPSLMKLYGYSPQTGQMASMVFNIFSVAGSLIMGFVVDRYGYRAALPLAYAGFLAGICGMALTGAVEPLLISTAVTGFFMMGAQYSLGGVSPMYYPMQERGLGTGAAIAFGRLGSITGPLMAGFILKSGLSVSGYHFAGPSGVASAMVPLVVLAGLAAWWLTRQAKINAL